MSKRLTITLSESLRLWIRSSLAYKVSGSERQAVFHYLRDGIMRDHKDDLSRKFEESLRLLKQLAEKKP